MKSQGLPCLILEYCNKNRFVLFIVHKFVQDMSQIHYIFGEFY